MRIQGHHPSPSEQSLPVGSGLDTDRKARLLLLGSQTPLPSTGFCSGPPGSGPVPQRGLQSVTAERQVGDGGKGAWAPQLGVVRLAATNLVLCIPRRALPLCMQHQGWGAGRPAALSAFVCGTETTIVSIHLTHQSVKPKTDKEQPREF